MCGNCETEESLFLSINSGLKILPSLGQKVYDVCSCSEASAIKFFFGQNVPKEILCIGQNFIQKAEGILEFKAGCSGLHL